MDLVDETLLANAVTYGFAGLIFEMVRKQWSRVP